MVCGKGETLESFNVQIDLDETYIVKTDRYIGTSVSQTYGSAS